MFFELELLYFVLMIGAFIVLLLFAKLPSGLCMMLSSLIGGVLSFFSVNNSIEPNCLSVIDNIPTCPSGGRKDLTRLICTSAFSALGQCRIYIENWNIMNPS